MKEKWQIRPDLLLRKSGSIVLKRDAVPTPKKSFPQEEFDDETRQDRFAYRRQCRAWRDFAVRRRLAAMARAAARWGFARNRIAQGLAKGWPEAALESGGRRLGVFHSGRGRGSNLSVGQ